MKTKNNTRKQFGTFIGVDLGDKKHAVCVTGKDGKVLREFSIANRREDLEVLAANYPGASVAMEVGTHSPWISRLLAAAGMRVLVANARKLRAIYTSERKSDRNDARMLAKLLRVDPELLHPVRHGSEEAQRDLLQIKLRDTLVRQRVGAVNSVRGSLKSLGVRLPPTSTQGFAKAARTQLAERPELLDSVDPLLKAIDELSADIKHYDKAIAKAADRHPQGARLQQIPGVGPVTALTFVLCIEDPSRFDAPRAIGPWLGLVPRRDQSGDSDKQLPITKAGNRYLRVLMVQCAQYLLGPFGPDCDLRRHGLKLAARGGKAAKKKAITAIARKLAVLMLTLWQRQSDYKPLRDREPGDAPGRPCEAA